MSQLRGWMMLSKDSPELDAKRAFENYYRESYSLVFNYIIRRVADRTAAEDVTSEAFLRAARFFDRFDASRAKFSTWVISIAHNCIIDYYRHNPSTSDLEEVPEGAYADESSYDEQTANADLAVKLLALLDPTERELISKKYYEGKRNVEIADEMGMNLSTVSTKLARALAKMRAAASEGGF